MKTIVLAGGNYIILSLIVLVALMLSAEAQTNLAAFPGAVGFGAMATGGRGGTIYHVSNLYDSGPGSFRDAVSLPNRIVVFDVGGYAAPTSTNVTNNAPIQVTNNITIAGQTAPGDGFGVMGREVSFGRATNVICRYIRCRQGSFDSNTGSPGLELLNASTMIFDHVSIEFGQWDNIDGVNSTNLTFQYCLNADPIGQQFGAHMEIGPVCWYRNLWANTHNRCPLARTDTIYVNNYIYNYQGGYTTAGVTATGGLTNFSHDVVNNYFVTGPSTTTPSDCFFQCSYSTFYLAGNMLDQSDDGILNGSAVTISDPTATFLTSPWSAVTTNLSTISAAATIPYVLSTAGCSLQRDAVDLQVIGNAFSLGTQGSLWTNQVQTGLTNNGYGNLTGGIAPVDSDQDGMPDYWELANGLNPNNPGDANTIGVSGYTHIEEYLNWLAGPHAVVSSRTTTTNSVSVDLWQYTMGFTNLSPSYAVFHPTNGTASLLPDGHTASFSPKPNYSGMASFTFTVTANSHAAMTNLVSVLVSPAFTPVITNVLISAGGLWLAGRGWTNASFYLLTSTNLAVPLTNWSCVLTSQFDANGNFRLTKAINPNLRQTFYMLRSP